MQNAQHSEQMRPSLLKPGLFLWLDFGLFLYLALVVAVYASGSRLAAWLGDQLGTMPVRGGLWSWAWSVDRVGPSEGAWLVGLTLAGGVAGAAWHWLAHTASSQRGRVSLGPLIGLALSAAAVLIFWYFRAGSSLGDFWNYALMLRFGNWFVMSQPLSTALLAGGHAVLSRLGWPTAASAELVICLFGAVWVFVVLRLAGELRGWQRGLMLVCGLLSGGLALFFGYIESTPIALAATIIYFYLGRATLVHQAPPWPAALAFGVSLGMHGQFVYLGPSLLILMMDVWRRGARRQVGWAIPLAILPVALVATYAWTHPELIEGPWYGDSLGGGDARQFVPLGPPETYAEYYSLFTFNYFTELANLVMRSAPLLGALVVPAAWGAWQQRRLPMVQWLVTMIVGAISFVMLWNPDLGMAHDWDLFAPSIMLIQVACICLWPPDWQPQPARPWLGMAAGFSVAALAITVSYFSPIRAWGLWDTRWRHLSNAMEVRFGEHVELLGYDGLRPSYQTGETLRVGLLWRTRAILSAEYTAGVYLIDADEENIKVIAQDDQRPEAPVPFPDRRYTHMWIVGEVVTDWHDLVIPLDTPAGEYEVWVVLYDYYGNIRLPITAPGAAAGANYLRLLTVTLE